MTIQSSPRSIEGGAHSRSTNSSNARRFLIGGGALVLVLAGFYWWTHSGNQAAGPRRTPSVPVQVAVAQQRDMPVVKDAIGTVIAYTTVQIAPRVSGVVEKADFKEGQIVKKGDLLFELDPRPFQAVLDQAQGQLGKDQAALVSAQQDQHRYATLYAQNAISSQLRDQSDATAKADAAVVEADRGTVEAARLNLEFTKIYAPVDGKTGPILLQEGNLVIANLSTTPLVTITQIKPIKVSFSLPQSDLPAIQQRASEGKLTAAITLHGGISNGRTLTAPVDFVSNTVTSTGTIELRSDFANQDAALVPGQLVDVTVELDDIPNAIVVPRVAVINGPNGTYVYRVSKGEVEQVPVSVQFDDGANMAVKGDLNAGDNVVSDGGLRVTPGAKVTIQRLTTRPAGGKGARGARGARGGKKAS
jgi:multidrug efflux system membrane fusion protein